MDESNSHSAHASVSYGGMTATPAYSASTSINLTGNEDEKTTVLLSTRTPSISKSSDQGKEKGVEMYATQAQEERGWLRSCIIVTTVTSAMVINTANSTTVSIALPTIARELNLQPDQIQWIIAAYPLSSGCLFLVCGRLADVYGRKITFLLGMVFLGVFTLACGFSKDILTLDILRGIQGIGGAAVIPAALGILAQAFPPSRARSLAFATFAAGAPVGAVFGTAVGGVLTEFTAHTWRSPFFLLAGLCFLALVGGWVSIDPDVHANGQGGLEQDKRIDWIGAFFVTAGLVLIVFVLSQGEVAEKGWRTPYIIALLVIGILLLVVFVYWQHYLEKLHSSTSSSPSSASILSTSLLTPPPLMKPSIWTRAKGRFAATLLIAFANWCAFMAWTFWVQLYYQDYLGLSAMQSVVRLLPMFVSGVACNVFVGFMAGYVSVGWIFATGAGATTLSCLLFAIIRPEASYWSYAFNATYLSVMGADFVFSAGTLFLAKFAMMSEQSVAGGLFNTMTQLGTALGVTVSTVVYNNVGHRLGIEGNEDDLPKYQAAQWTAFGFGCVATILCIVSFRGVGVVGDRKPKSVPPAALDPEGRKFGSGVDVNAYPNSNGNDTLTVPPTPSGTMDMGSTSASGNTTMTLFGQLPSVSSNETTFLRVKSGLEVSESASRKAVEGCV